MSTIFNTDDFILLELTFNDLLRKYKSDCIFSKIWINEEKINKFKIILEKTPYMYIKINKTKYSSILTLNDLTIIHMTLSDIVRRWEKNKNTSSLELLIVFITNVTILRIEKIIPKLNAIRKDMQNGK